MDLAGSGWNLWIWLESVDLAGVWAESAGARYGDVDPDRGHKERRGGLHHIVEGSEE